MSVKIRVSYANPQELQEVLEQLAEISGVSRATINYIKSGKSCSDEIGKKIAKALKVKITDIIE